MRKRNIKMETLEEQAPEVTINLAESGGTVGDGSFENPILTNLIWRDGTSGKYCEVRSAGSSSGGGGTSYVVTPKIIAPTNDSTNQPTVINIVGTAYRNVFPDDARSVRKFQISKNDKFSSVDKEHEADADSWTVDAPLDANTIYYVRIKDVSTSDFESNWSSVVKFTTGEAGYIVSPTITLKGYNDSTEDFGRDLKIELSEFQVSDDQQDEHESTSYYIDAVDTFAARSHVWEKLKDTTNKTGLTVTVEALQPSTKYRLSVIYHGKKLGDSAIATKEFTTSSDFGKVNTPTLTVEGETNNVYETPKLTGGEFSNTREKDTHDKSDWEIIPAAGGDAVWSSKDDTKYKTTITVDKGKLKVKTAYKARLRYHGVKLGWSEWAEKEFSTVDSFVKVKTPTVSGKTADVFNVDRFNGSTFTMEAGGPGSHDMSDWILYKKEAPTDEIWSSKNDGTNKTQSPVEMKDHLAVSSNYILKLRYHDATNNIWSDYGQIEFATADEFKGIVTPTITVEGTESTAVNYDSNFSASEFQFIGGSDTCDKVDWILYKDDVEVWSMKDAKPFYLLGGFPGYRLEQNTDYTLKHRQHAKELNGWSSFGEVQFTTAKSFNYPTIKFRAKGSIDVKNMCVWWNSELKVYKNGELHSGTSLSLSDGGDLIEIKNETRDNYPMIIFNGKKREDYGPNILSIEAPLPALRDRSNQDLSKYLGNTGDDGRDNQQGGDGYGAFYNCTSLTSLPQDLLKYCTQLTHLGGAGGDGGFATSGSLNNGGGAYGAFQGCTSLTSLPQDLLKYCTQLTHLGGAAGDGGAGSFPGDGGDGMGAFQGCTSLTSLPQDLLKYCTQLTHLGGAAGDGGGNGRGGSGVGYGAFEGCTSLTSLPQDLLKYCTQLTHLGGAAGRGSKYKTDSRGAFQKCSKLVVDVRISALEVTNAATFADATKAKGTARVPSGSTTAKTLRSDSSANVNVIEE